MSNKKSTAKRIGIKSVFAHGEDKLTITSFGKGNRAEVVLHAPDKGRSANCPVNAKLFTVNHIDESIGVEQGLLEPLLNNPAENVGEDYLQFKGVLEKYFFGKEFPNDTVRIQIIHNILDIMKIFGLYVNDIIFTINNLSDEPDDIVGMGLGDEKMKAALKKMTPYFGFFGEAFRLLRKDKHGKEIPDATVDEHNKDVLRILSDLRQWSAHFKDSNIFFSKYDSIQKKFKETTNQKTKTVEKELRKWKIIVDSYRKRINDVNKNFLNHSKINLHIIFDLFGARDYDTQTELVQEYYRFSILKEGKNLGVNMTKVREFMIEAYYPELKNKKHDSYRHKIYTILDYIIFRNLRNSEELETMVSELRSASDDETKDRLYVMMSEHVHVLLDSIIHPFLDRFDGSFPAFTSETIDVAMLGKVAFGRSEELPFVQMISFLCNFLEGKEINELLTAYIHKFENIQSFINTLTELGDKVVFADGYKSFNKFSNQLAQRIADQLRVLASIGKMKPDMEGAKRLLFKAAIETLGILESSAYVTNEWLEENLLLDRNDDAHYKKKKTDVNPLRNFIAGNVISSRRFMYLVRYSKPKTIRALMQNRKIVRYVLTRLPEAQVDSYCKNIVEESDKKMTLDQKCDLLTQRLTGLSFETIWNERQGIVANTKNSSANKNIKIEQLKGLVALYLTVAYVAIKNLVKANARYYIAYSAFERDYFFLCQQHGSEVSGYDILYTFQYKGKDKDAKCVYFSPIKFYLKQEEKNDYKPEPGQPFDKEACRKHLDSIRRHFTRKWRDIFEMYIKEAES
ncbi:MAG: type VI-D CRISPR-associated RNA-guided ribonuclease Cas13d, partial [Planctomycetia bacterium]|nr:type VI-D CRISPR-associated RNA-guided ribonuclease Cas13d [Planctomycetia bacterium]